MPALFMVIGELGKIRLLLFYNVNVVIYWEDNWDYWYAGRRFNIWSVKDDQLLTRINCRNDLEVIVEALSRNLLQRFLIGGIWSETFN